MDEGRALVAIEQLVRALNAEAIDRAWGEALAAVEKKNVVKKLDVTTAEGWLAVHAAHGCGPWFDVKIGVWNVVRCRCGEKFRYTDEQRIPALASLEAAAK